MRRKQIRKLLPLPQKTVNPLIRAAEAAAVLVQMSSMHKQPKFFCENCNSEVRRDAMICPHCGRFFASVRCPACEFTGTHKEFKDGCPSCGYAFTSDVQKNEKGNTKKVKQKKLGIIRHTGYKANARPDTDPLPLWIYGLVLLLGAVLAAIFFLY